MEVLHQRCAGLDVHKLTVVACVRIALGGKAKLETRTFGTTTKELMDLGDWLEDQGCTIAAMESTGVFWRPIWHMLEGRLELVLGNATQLRNVPGRKSDVSDAQWLADLVAHGLVRPSFVPPAEVQELRDLTRTRKQFVRGRAREVQRLQKVLEDCNIKLSSVVSDITGKTGRAILVALSEGQTDPNMLAQLAQGSLKKRRGELVQALHGKVTPHHQFMLRLHLDQVAAIELAISEVEERVSGHIAPFRDAWDRLAAVPGVSSTSASVILAEVGTDMSRFPTAAHLISWAGLCPRMDESAGKRRNTRLRKGAPWLKTVLVQCAWAAIRVKDTYLRGQYHRLKARRGAMKAIIAVAASMLTGVYHMLKFDKPWIDLGHDYYDQVNHGQTVRRLCRRLQNLGYDVDLRQAATVSA